MVPAACKNSPTQYLRLVFAVFATGWAARFGSALFLIIQMIILLDFTQSWNDAWVANGEEDPRWLYGLLGLTVTAFLGVLGISGRWCQDEAAS
jgi:hypothetical protein